MSGGGAYACCAAAAPAFVSRSEFNLGQMPIIDTWYALSSFYLLRIGTGTHRTHRAFLHSVPVSLCDWSTSRRIYEWLRRRRCTCSSPVAGYSSWGSHIILYSSLEAYLSRLDRSLFWQLIDVRATAHTIRVRIYAGNCHQSTSPTCQHKRPYRLRSTMYERSSCRRRHRPATVGKLGGWKTTAGTPTPI